MHRLGVAGQQRAVQRVRGRYRLGQPRHPVRVRRPRAGRRRQRVEEGRQVTAGRGGQGHMRGDPSRSVGHVHDLRRFFLWAERAICEPEVKRCACHNNEVGLAQRHRPGSGDQQVVPARQHPARLPVGHHGQAQFLGRPPRRVLGAAQPHVRAQDQHRPPRHPEQVRDPADVLRIGGYQRHRLRVGHIRLGLPVARLQRDVEEHRPPVRARGQPEGLIHRCGHLGRLVLGPGPLGDRRQQWRVIDLLQAARTPAVVGRAPGEHHDRGPVEPGRGHRADRVGHAGPRRDRGQPGSTGQPGGRLGREHGGLLVPHVHQWQRRVRVHRRVVEREYVPARQREHRRYAVAAGRRHRLHAAVPRYPCHGSDVTSR